MTKTGSYGTSASPLFLRPNGISICGYLFLCLNTAFFKYLWVSDRFGYRKLNLEDSWVENLTAGWLLLGGFLLFATALVERDTLRRRVYTLGYLALIFAAGEEISWGQRIFDYPTPQILREINTQGEFNLHNIIRYWPIFNKIMHSGTFLLCAIAIAALFCGKRFVFRIPLPSILLMFGFLIALCYEHLATPEEYLLKGTGAVWLIILIFMLFSRQYELFYAAATAMIIILAVVVINWTNLLWMSEIGHHEPQEYLISFVYFWYSFELFLAQNPLRGEGWVVQWKKWLAERVQPSLPHFSPDCSMTDFLRSPLVITCFFVVCTNLGLLYLGYTAAELRNEAIHIIHKARKDHTPAIRSYFDIYLSGNFLIYTKESCITSDTKAPFFLHVYPSDKRDMPSRCSQYAFDNLDFFFSDHGKLFDDKCVAAVRLPRYDISRIVSGQHTSEGRLWEAEFSLSAGEEHTTMVRDPYPPER